jgi:putative NADPH-quinone reductase
MNRKRKILLINGHPDPSPERLCCALAGAYAQGAQDAGHDVRRIELGTLSFPFLQSAETFAAPPPHPAILAARDDFLWAEHLVFVYPLWLGSQPAMLKAFMEWVACGDFLLRAQGARMPKGKLARRSARSVVTMGMPALAYRILFGAHGSRAFEKGILGLAGVKPVRTTYLGMAGTSPRRHRRWLGRMRALGAKAS